MQRAEGRNFAQAFSAFCLLISCSTPSPPPIPHRTRHPTRNSQSRRISRSANEHVLEQMNARVAAHPEILRKRKAIVEHPFGTIKRWMNQAYFLMRGLAKVRAEFSLSALAYNLSA